MEEKELEQVIKGGLSISEFTQKLMDEINRKQQEVIVDDIMEIQNGNFISYDSYVRQKQNLINEIEEKNELSLSTSGNLISYNFYVKPLILSKEMFEYIVKQYGNQ